MCSVETAIKHYKDASEVLWRVRDMVQNNAWLEWYPPEVKHGLLRSAELGVLDALTKLHAAQEARRTFQRIVYEAKHVTRTNY